ncbi:regulatory protein RecX [Balneola sp. MJW-20]|uniref:regulatory protein RecX n=1 Tax=Gracilimonas aurantiaca TaxID=3234185 RepID=UPI0034652D09
MKKKDKFKDRYPDKKFDLLPAPVSSIQVQKKNKTRFSVFVNDTFLIGISDSALTRFNIRKGKEITRSLLQSLIDHEEQFAAREYMIGLLSRRDHSRKELYTKSIKKGFESSYLNDILDQLEQKGYINDRSFAEKFVHDKFEFRQWGPYKIRAELAKKGIYGEDADRALNIVLDKEDIVESMFGLISKKKARYLREDPDKRRNKIFDFLRRKGYDSSIILNHLDELLNKIES